MYFVAQIVYEAPAEEEAKAFERGLKKGLRAAVEHWHRKMAPEHFKPGAKGRYQYRRRSKQYMERKERKFEHQDPLTFTGTSKHWILGKFPPGRIRKLKSGGFEASVAMSAPKYFFQYRTKGSPEQSKAAELKRTVSGEHDVLKKIVDKHIDAELAKPRRKRRTRKTA